MTGKRLYRVGTDVGPEDRWAFSARQALWFVWDEYRRRGAKTTWAQAEAGWSVDRLA